MNQNLASLAHKLWVWQCYEVVLGNGTVEPSQGKLIFSWREYLSSILRLYHLGSHDSNCLSLKLI